MSCTSAELRAALPAMEEVVDRINRAEGEAADWAKPYMRDTLRKARQLRHQLRNHAAVMEADGDAVVVLGGDDS